MAAVHCPPRAAGIIGKLGRLLTDGGSVHPQALLERSLRPGRSMGPLARALEEYFSNCALAVPTNHGDVLAAGRRQRRVDAVPEHLRPAVSDFAESLMTARQRARRCHTRPRSDSTIDTALSTVRDLAIFLTSKGKDDWSLVTASDVEAFLVSRNPGNRPRTLIVVGQFFRWARARKLVLVNPAKGISAKRSRGFTGATLSVDRQRQLFHRWTTDPNIHPHEPLVGLLALLHGASGQETRNLKLTDVDEAGQAVHLGTRPHPTPLDPPTWSALQHCIRQRELMATSNPHVLVTRGTKADSRPASSAYLTHILDPAGTSPRALRVTRLAELVNTLDPKLVATAFGMDAGGVLAYLADHVDEGRLPEPGTNHATFGAT